MSPKLLRYNKNLKELEEMLAMALSKKFRTTLLDDYGQGWIYSWYCVDHINLNKNPRSKIIGYGRVFEFYKNILKNLKIKVMTFIGIFIHDLFQIMPYRQRQVTITQCQL